MSEPTPHEQAAGLYDQLAEELEQAARHARTAAGHHREREGARGAAHGFATHGHLTRARAILDRISDLHASRAKA